MYSEITNKNVNIADVIGKDMTFNEDNHPSLRKITDD